MGVALMGMLADAVARGRKKKTAKESGFWDGIWGRFILANIELILPWFGVGRWITSGIKYGYAGSTNLVTVKALDEGKNLISDAIKGDLGRAAGHLLRFVGYGAGLPVLGVDELMRWLKPDNAASPSTAPRQSAPRTTAPRQTAPRQTAP
jgi:hypothetical protein